MRVDSAAVSKGHWGQSANLAPKEGTKLRCLYDLLMANKGLPIDLPLTRFGGNRNGIAIEQLRDFYGLDIRKLKSKRWVLAGEWFGKTYRDYIADRLAEFDRKTAPGPREAFHHRSAGV